MLPDIIEEPVEETEHHFVFDGTQHRPRTDEEELMVILFKEYDESLRPVYDGNKTVVVDFSIQLIGISNMDEIAQVLETSVWLEMYWKEERLQWDSKRYHIHTARIPGWKVWLPDIVLYNSADDYQDKQWHDFRVMVQQNGDTFLGPFTKLRSSCIMDLTLYPFDEQECNMTFGSWTYDSRQFQIGESNIMVRGSEFVESEKWQLLDTKTHHSYRYSDCCPDPFTVVTFTIKIRRRFLFNNLFNIFLPCSWLSLLTLMCFWMPPESGEKITLGITLLLTFTIFIFMVAENTPRTSDHIPLISIYLTITIATTSGVVAIQVFILQLRSANSASRRAPFWLRFFTLRFLSVLLRVRGRHYPKGAKNGDGTAVLVLPPKEPYKVFQQRPILGKKTIQVEESQRLMLEQIRLLSAEYDDTEVNNGVVNEWRQIAFVLDRLAFWAFFLFTSTASTFILIYVPASQHDIHEHAEGADESTLDDVIATD